jgi:hypothetical protein
MGRIHGGGAAKLERYGQTFLALIRDHATPGSDELRVEPVSE